MADEGNLGQDLPTSLWVTFESGTGPNQLPWAEQIHFTVVVLYPEEVKGQLGSLKAAHARATKFGWPWWGGPKLHPASGERLSQCTWKPSLRSSFLTGGASNPFQKVLPFDQAFRARLGTQKAVCALCIPLQDKSPGSS